jgi:hypothetical protein
MDVWYYHDAANPARSVDGVITTSRNDNDGIDQVEGHVNDHRYNNHLVFTAKSVHHIAMVMTLSKGANSSGLQVQSVVARVNFRHGGTWGLISNSQGTVEKALVVLLQATCKTTFLSCVPNSTE